MPNDLIDDEAFEFFTEAKSLRQHCHLLTTELAELHGELKDSRGKLAPLVLMWFGVSREAARAESELPQTKVARMEVYVVGVMYLKTMGNSVCTSCLFCCLYRRRTVCSISSAK
jgi:hypothetical protein